MKFLQVKSENHVAKRHHPPSSVVSLLSSRRACCSSYAVSVLYIISQRWSWYLLVRSRTRSYLKTRQLTCLYSSTVPGTFKTSRHAKFEWSSSLYQSGRYKPTYCNCARTKKHFYKVPPTAGSFLASTSSCKRYDEYMHTRNHFPKSYQ